MSNQTAFRIGYALARLPRWLRYSAPLLAALVLVSKCAKEDASPPPKHLPSTQTVTAKPAPLSKAQVCEQSLAQQKQAYADFMAAKQYWQAANAIRVCTSTLATGELKDLLKDAEVASHLADINNHKLPSRDRAQAMQMLARDYPEIGGKYEKAANQLIAAENQKAETLHRAQQKSRGVTIGMTPDEVLASSWGKPTRVKTTTTAFGSHEQWIYPGDNYLYFENGRLTSVQN